MGKPLPCLLQGSSHLPPAHLAPGRANLPVAAEVQLTRLGDVGPGEMPTTLWRHRGATASKFLSAEQLAVLGARAAGPAAGRPFPSLPAVNVGGAERKMGRDVWGLCEDARLGPSGEKGTFHSWRLHS